MRRLTQSDIGPASRVGLLFFALHSIVLLLVAPSAFLYYGDGFLLSKHSARLVQGALNGFLDGAVYELINYRLPPGILWWLYRVTGSLDVAGTIYQTALLFILGGVFYFALGFVAASVRRSFVVQRVRTAA